MLLTSRSILLFSDSYDKEILEENNLDLLYIELSVCFSKNYFLQIEKLIIFL